MQRLLLLLILVIGHWSLVIAPAQPLLRGPLTTNSPAMKPSLTDGLLDARTNNLFRVPVGVATNLVITNLAVGQVIRIDLFVTNGFTVTFPQQTAANTAQGWLVPVQSNAWQTVIVSQPASGETNFDFRVAQFLQTVGLSMALDTNFATRTVTIRGATLSSNGVTVGGFSNLNVVATGGSNTLVQIGVTNGNATIQFNATASGGGSSGIATINGAGTNLTVWQQTGSTNPAFIVLGTNGLTTMWTRTNTADGGSVLAIGTNLATATLISNWNGMTHIISSNGAPILTLNGAAGRVGINQTAPAALLDIAGTVGATVTPLFHAGTNSTTGLTVTTNGNVGVGTATPQGMLSVTNSDGSLDVLPDTLTFWRARVLGVTRSTLTIANTPTLTLVQSTGNGMAVSAAGSLTRTGSGNLDVTLIPLNSGNVGIATANPLASLHVTNTAAQTDPLRIHTKVGDGSLFAFGVSSNRLALFGATGVTNTPPAGYAGMFAETNTGTIELAVIDSAGNVTQISPHPRDCPPAFLITTNWLSGWPEVGKSVKLYSGTVTWKNNSLSSLVQRWQLESTILASNYMLLMPAQLRALLPSALVVEESFSEYNTRLGLTPGNGGLVENNWDVVQNNRQNDYNLGRTNELIAYNTPILFTNDIGEVSSSPFNTNIVVRPVRDVKEQKPALVEFLSPEIRVKKNK